MEEEKTCKCGENCECGENCTCNEEEKCNENCTCHGKKKKDKKYEALKKQVDEYKEEALRSKADLVNYRKRKDEEVVRMLKYANEDLVKELLPTIDNLERALKLESENEEVTKFLSGVKLIYCSTIATLEKYGVKAIDGSNKAFDPTYHQAVMTEHVDSVEPGIVIEVLQKGYLLKDKVIRPAMVKVSE